MFLEFLYNRWYLAQSDPTDPDLTAILKDTPPSTTLLKWRGNFLESILVGKDGSSGSSTLKLGELYLIQWRRPVRSFGYFYSRRLQVHLRCIGSYLGPAMRHTNPSLKLLPVQANVTRPADKPAQNKPRVPTQVNVNSSGLMPFYKVR